MFDLVNVQQNSGRPPSACRVVPYTSKDRAAVADLQTYLWNADRKLNTAYLDWKYHENPYIREPLIYLAYVGERLAAMRGAFGTRWEIGDPMEYVTLPYPDDLVVDPDFREQGLHRIIMNFALDDLAKRGYRYVLNLSAGRIARHASLNMQWREAGGMMPVSKRTLRKGLAQAAADIARRIPFAWRTADGLSNLGGAREDGLFREFDSRSPAPTRSRHGRPLFTQTAPLTKEMAGLIARLPRTGRLRHVRDEPYFEWRFRNPLRSYRFLYAGGDRIEGYLVLQRALSGSVDRVSIVDWEGESDDVLEDLLDAAIEQGRFPALYAWCLGASPSLRAMLARRGFAAIRSNYENCVLVRSVRDADLGTPWIFSGRRLDDPGEWDMRMLYSMEG